MCCDKLVKCDKQNTGFWYFECWTSETHFCCFVWTIWSSLFLKCHFLQTKTNKKQSKFVFNTKAVFCHWVFKRNIFIACCWHFENSNISTCWYPFFELLLFNLFCRSQADITLLYSRCMRIWFYPAATQPQTQGAELYISRLSVITLFKQFSVAAAR